MVFEDRWVEGQPGEDDGEEAGRPGEQPAVGDAQIEGGERRREQGPADRDPLAVELQGNGGGDAGEDRPGDQGEPPRVAFRERGSSLQPHQAGEEEGEGDRLRHRERPDHPAIAPGEEGVPAEEEERQAGEDCRQIGLPEPPRPFSRSFSENEGEGEVGR